MRIDPDDSLFQDADFDEEDFAIIDAIVEQLEMVERPSTYIVDQKRVYQMVFAYAALRHVLREAGSNVKITCGYNEFTPSLGEIHIEGATLVIKDTKWFIRAAEFASNWEVYPLEADQVRMSFGFRGVAVPAT
jgi:hypothetical protein